MWEMTLQYGDENLATLLFGGKVIALYNVNLSLFWQIDFSGEYLMKELRRHDRCSILGQEEVKSFNKVDLLDLVI